MSGKPMPTSTNLISKTQLPSFVEMLDASHKNIIKGLWNVDDLSISDKINSIDAISKDMPLEARREYRKWRFLMDRSRMPDFYDSQNKEIKIIISGMFEKFTDLEDFARIIMNMKSALNNPDAFDKWMKNEEIEFKDAEERNFDREKLKAEKEQIDMQLKHLEYQRTMCNTGDLETCYTNRQLLSKEIVEEKRNLNRERLEFDREKLEAEKERTEMQLKRLDIYQAVCNARDSEKYYIDNILPSIEDARQCMDTVYTLIDFARELVEECEAQFCSDYRKVSDKICNFTMHACERALRDLDIGRDSITSRAVKSLMILSYSLTEERRKELLEALYNLEKAENELRELCEQMKSNVKHRSSFDKLKELIENIKKAAETFRDRIYSVPIEGSAANAIEGIKELKGEIKKLTANLCNPMKSLLLLAPNAQPDLEQ